ncbi:substrate-binding periplasmic protein [Nitrincola sp. A-D6]|uniref:substrate-binding periplasmic protein n=1 Tax=Nitrincola sp. A-D6 TaxID=1545442 RepID=UPI00068A5620|nr:transporter substrate-binding domain-containing protein [Nitrincola sp. A-D6]
MDIAYALCEAMQRDCELIAVPWIDILDGIEEGDYQLIVASMARTAEREQRVDFSDYYYRSHSVFVGNPYKYSNNNPESLEGVRLATGIGTVQEAFLRSRYPAADIIVTESQEQALAQLVSGEVDLVLSDSINLLSFLQSAEGTQFDFIAEPLIDELLKTDAHIAIQKGNEALRSAINQALITIRLNGTYERINRKYIPFSIY